MKPVNGDCLFLVCVAACRTVPQIVQNWGRTGRRLSQDQYRVLSVVTVLHQRFMRDEYQASYDEAVVMGRAQQLLSDMSCESQGLHKRDVEFAEQSLFCRNGPLPPPPGAYGDVMQAVASGVLEGDETESREIVA